ncbi:MAG: helix-turn-helix domain-containing protein [Burkholderiaceae bacterium]
MTRASGPRIVNYALFGEVAEVPSLVHCETIEARAPLHGRRLGIHRHPRLHQWVLLAAGSGRAQLETDDLAMRAPCVVNIPPGVVHAFRFARDAAGWVITWSGELLARPGAESERLRPLLMHACMTGCTPVMLALASAMQAEHDGRAFAADHVIGAQAMQMLGLIARQMDRGPTAELGARADRHLRRFTEMVDKHWAERRSVSDYAAGLGITVHHLGRLTRAASGQTPRQWITERLVQEARRYLAYSDLPITAIANRLGFGDPAHFSRVFSRATGRAPRAFRASLTSID